MSRLSFPSYYDQDAGRQRTPIFQTQRVGGQIRPGAAVPYAELDPPFLRGANVLRGGYDGASEPMYPSAQPTNQGTLRQQNEGLLPRGPSSPGAVNAGIVTRSREAGAARVASQYGMEHAAPGAGKATMGLTEEQALQMLNVISQQNPGIPPHDLLPQFTAKLGEYGIDSQRAGHLMGQFGQGGYQFDYPQPGTGKPAGERTVMVPSAGPYREFPNGQVGAEVGGQGGTGAYQLANGSIARVGPNGQQVGSAAPGPAPATIPLQVPTAAVPPTMGPKQGYTPIAPSLAPSVTTASPTTQPAVQPTAGAGLDYARRINASMMQQQAAAAPAIDPRVAALQQNHADSLELQNDLAGAQLYGPNVTLNRQMGAAQAAANVDATLSGADEARALRAENQRLQSQLTHVQNSLTMANRGNGGQPSLRDRAYAYRSLVGDEAGHPGVGAEAARAYAGFDPATTQPSSGQVPAQPQQLSGGATSYGGVQPATTAQRSARTIVRTGTYQGRRVVQYSDGSTDYQ